MQRKQKAYVMYECRQHHGYGAWYAYDKKTHQELLDDTDFDRLCNALSDYGYGDVEYIPRKPVLVAKPN
jgi:hypothetical protein